MVNINYSSKKEHKKHQRRERKRQIYMDRYHKSYKRRQLLLFESFQQLGGPGILLEGLPLCRNVISITCKHLGTGRRCNHVAKTERYLWTRQCNISQGLTYLLIESVVLSRGWSLIGFWVCVGPVSTKKSAKIVRIAGDWKKGKKFTTLGLVAATVNDW